MKLKFTKEELLLIDHSKQAVISHNKKRHSKGGIDTIYSFVLSDSGNIYEGACLETSTGSICAEQHAIANMVLSETYSSKIKSIVVLDPVPKIQKTCTTPCGTCRQVIWERGNPNTSVICIQYIQTKKGWGFPKLEKYVIKELYPNAYESVKWD